MQQTKIVLSPEEHQLVCNAQVILTKNAVIGKVCALFGILNEAYSSMLKSYPALQQDAGIRSPKISKGEQYRGLPWVMLDHPRNFQGPDSFAIRSFFWWGHYCSITLHLSGVYQEKYAGVISRHIQQNNGWYIAVGNDAWQHHHDSDNYLPVAQFTGNMMQLPFLKLSKKTSLEKWDLLDEFYLSAYSQILEWMH